jgi:hypothetical protein
MASFRFVVCRTEAACGSRKATTRRLPLPPCGEGSVVDVDLRNAFDFDLNSAVAAEGGENFFWIFGGLRE